MAAVGTFAAYAWVYVTLDRPLDQARTTATLALFAIGMVIVVIVARPLTRARALMIAAMIGVFALILAVPALRTFYGMDMPPFWIWTSATLIAGAVALVIQLLIPGRLAEGLEDQEDDGSRPMP
jgi:hypothetical protein